MRLAGFRNARSLPHTPVGGFVGRGSILQFSRGPVRFYLPLCNATALNIQGTAGVTSCRNGCRGITGHSFRAAIPGVICRSFADEVANVLIVLFADIFDQFRIRLKFGVLSE